jgi:SAM-dependent methyltransferase
MAVAEISQEKATAFEDKMVDVLNGGALALMISIGHRTGLLDTLAELPPSNSEAIAAAANLNERYVREWLGALYTGGVLEHDEDAGTYALPAEHAACLTRASAPNNLAAFTQYMSVLGGVEDQIVTCFREGGGVPYSAFPRFQEVMAEDSGQSVLPALLDDILPLVPGLQERLEQGIDVVDVGCGVGRALNLLARTYPNSRFTGYEISEEGMAAGRREAEANGCTNIQFITQDAATINDEEAFDLVCTFDAVHDQAKPDLVLKNIQRALRPDGVYLMQDINAHSHHHGNAEHPIGTLLYTVSCLHCMTVSLADDGAGLGAMWGVELAQDMLKEAGFSETQVHELGHDIQNCYYINRK